MLADPTAWSRGQRMAATDSLDLDALATRRARLSIGAEYAQDAARAMKDGRDPDTFLRLASEFLNAAITLNPWEAGE